MSKPKYENIRCDDRKGPKGGLRVRADVNKTAIIEARCDVRVVRTIVAYFDSINYAVYTKSDVVSQALKALANILVSNGLVGEYDDLVEAADFMNMRFRTTKRDRRAQIHVNAVATSADINREYAPLSRKVLSQDEINIQALNWAKENSPEQYKEMIKMPEFAKYIDGSPSKLLSETPPIEEEKHEKFISEEGAGLSPEAQKVPDLMSMMPSPVKK